MNHEKQAIRTVRCCVLPVLGLIVDTSHVQAEGHQDPPSSYVSMLLKSADDVGTMAIVCKAASEDRSLRVYDCQVRHTLVSKAPAKSASDWQQTEKKVRLDLAKQMKRKKRWAKECADNLAYFARARAQLEGNAHAIATLELEEGDYRAMCACSDATCAARAYLAQERRKDGRTCSIMSTTFDARFERRGDNTWVSLTEPQGLCGVVLTQVLEYDPQAKEWTFIQKRATTVQEQACAGLDRVTKLSSQSSYHVAAKMNCEYVSPVIP